MTTVVFLGPTMPLAQARLILPEAVFLPPAEQGDVISAVLKYEPSVIALIDGAFLHSLSVWHKELLWALDQGIQVMGASSMGALRAAECASFGMEGVGRIYEDYASGALTADDEVALSHADAEHDWQPLSEALVNVRATLAAAVAAGVVSDATADAVVSTGQQIYFPDRTWDSILGQLASVDSPHHCDPAELLRLRAFARTSAVDQKQLDAIELLKRIAEVPGKTSPDSDEPELPWEFHHSRPFSGLLARDRKVYRDAGPVTVEQVFRHLMLHRPESSELLMQASLQELGMVFAELLGIVPTADQEQGEATRFRRRRHLVDEDAFTAYLERNDLRSADFEALMTRQATLRALVAWLRLRRYRIGLADPVLNALRLRDEYAPWADRAARAEATLSAGAEPDELQPLLDLANDHLAQTSWRPDTDLTSWAVESDFGDLYQLHGALNRTAAMRQELLKRAADPDLLALLADPDQA